MADYVLEIVESWVPAECFANQVYTRHQAGWITGPSRTNNHLEIDPRYALHSTRYLQHRISSPVATINHEAASSFA
jgi:hypothetical protein